MNAKKGFQIVGDIRNPYHLSIGAVVIKDGLVALIKKANEHITLPRETLYSDESLDAGIKRGMREELGVLIEVIKFLGSQTTFFNRADGTNVEKTTIYFLTQAIGNVKIDRQIDEISDEVLWVDLEKATELLSTSAETEIINRVLNNI